MGAVVLLRGREVCVEGVEGGGCVTGGWFK
jgi:hypothetical protein